MKWICFAMILLTLVCGIASAQTVTGSIAGTVKDQSGAVVPNATVTVTDADKNLAVRTVKTTGTGDYSFPGLPVGHYNVTVEAANFQKFTQSGITLNVNDAINVSPQLHVGSGTEQITVEGQAEQINLESAVATGVVSGTQVREMVVNNRAFQALVALVPGVSDANNNDVYQVGATNGAGGFNTFGFQINGGRREQANWLVDGMDNMDRGSNLTFLAWPSVDAISEFRVVRGVYDPESGRSAGGQINVITRSGTSSFHGGIYEFFRNNYLNANTPFNKFTQKTNNVANKPPLLRYNDFGGTIGGPVYIPKIYEQKNKTFFFVSEEARRIITYTVPTPPSLPYSSMLTGNFNHVVCTAWANTNGTHGPCTAYGKTINPASIDPVASAYVKDFFSKLPGPNTPTAANPFQYVTTLRNVFNFREDLVKIDHNFGSRLTINGKYQHDSIPTREAGGLGASYGVDNVATTLTNSPGKQYRFGATFTATPTFLIDGAYGYSYGAILTKQQGLVSTAASPDVMSALKGIPFTNTVGRIPIVNISGGAGVPGVTTPYSDYNTNQSTLGNVTWVRGKHTMKFGAIYYHYNKHENLLSNNNTGTFGFDSTNAPSATTTFNGSTVCSGTAATGGTCPFTYEQSFANFLLGQTQAAGGFSQASLDNTANVYDNQFEYYAQDTWHMRPNLTVTYGVRHSFFRQPTDASGPHGSSELSQFDPALWDPSKAPCILPNGNLDVKFVNGLPVSSACNPNYSPLNGYIYVNPPTFAGFTGIKSPFGSKVGKEFNRAIAPRFGISWDPWGDGRTAVRAGYGMFYDNGLEFGQAELLVGLNPGFIQNLNFSNVSFAAPTASTTNTVAGTLASSAAAGAIDDRAPINYKSPYTQQWSLDLQHQFTQAWMVDIGYYGNNGIHLPGYIDSNAPALNAWQKCAAPNNCKSGNNVIQFTATGGSLPGGAACNGIPCITSGNTNGLTILRPYIGYAGAHDFEEIYTSNYNSLQAQIQRKFSGQSIVNLAYTWSHALTTYQADRSTGAIMPQGAAPIMRNNYGPGFSDRRHILTANFVWEIPWLRSQQGFVGHILGGWEVTGIQTFQTGLPLTPSLSGAGIVDPAGTGCLGNTFCAPRPDQVGNLNASPSSCPGISPCYQTWNGWYNPTAVVCYGNASPCIPYTGQTNFGTERPGAARGPGIMRTDMGIFKNIKFTERLTSQFRLETFNTWNHINPICCTSNVLTSASFAKPSGTLTPRNVQLALKLNF